jgi:CPA2 family monovalent cation:H+ antiporter-2
MFDLFIHTITAIQIPLLPEVVGILALATVVILLSRKLRLPTIIGYLITGIIVGPSGFNVISASPEFDALAEIGIILLLFVIGMEFSLKNLAQIKNIVLIGGGVQVSLTIALVAALVHVLGLALNTSVFIGFLFSLSSTAIVLKLFQERADIGSPHGKIALGILIFQDIVIVPLMLFTPILAGESDNVALSLGMMALKGILVVAVVILSAKKIFPYILYQIAKTKSQELMILSTVGICFAVAYGTSVLGLSLGLGAFMAGLIISESEYSHQATSNVLPFRELFISFFFVSIGILFDGGFMLQQIHWVVLLTLGTFILKGSIAAFAARILGFPLRTSMMVGISLFQVGEFSLLLSKTGLDYGLLNQELYQYFLSVSILTMAITPFAIRYLDQITFTLMSFRVIRKMNKPFDRLAPSSHEHAAINLEVLEDHLIIIGFGLNGKNLARAARHAKIVYEIIEMNAETVNREKLNGEPIHYGDATSPHVLHTVHAERARVAVIAISDPAATKRIVSALKSINKSLFIIVRTRFVNEMEENYRLGANVVIPEEFETSVEIFTRVLHKYLVPGNEIRRFAQSIRDDNYEMLRGFPARTAFSEPLDHNIPELNIISIRVEKGRSDVVGKSLKESKIRQKYDVNLLAIKRGSETITELDGESMIQCEDILYLAGNPKKLFSLCEQISLESMAE